MRARILLSLLLILMLFISGCWDSKDINKRALPVAIGIEKFGENEYKVGLRIPEPQGSTMEIRHVEALAPTVPQAIEKMRMKMENDIDLLHLKLILISEQIAREGVEDIIEFAMQSNSIQPKAMVAIVRGDMSELLSHKVEDGEEAGQGFYDFFSKQAGWTPHTSKARVWEVYRALYFHTEDIAIPILKKEEETMFQFVGSAIMYRNKMVGSIDPDETLLYNVFQHKYYGAHIEVMNHASVLVLDADAKIKANMLPNDSFVMNRMRLIVTIEEMKRGTSLHVVEDELVKLVKARYRTLVNKLQTNHADMLGFGQRFRKQMTQEQLKDWRNEIYPKLRTELDVKVVIRNGGSIKPEKH